MIGIKSTAAEVLLRFLTNVPFRRRRRGSVEIERLLGWDPIPRGPAYFEATINLAQTALASSYLTDDQQASNDLPRLWDLLIDDPRFALATPSFRAAIINRSGVAHLNKKGGIDKAIDRFEWARKLDMESDLSPARSTHNLGLALAHRYSMRGNRTDLDNAAQFIEEARSSASPPLISLCNATLAGVLEMRYRASGERSDIESAVQLSDLAVAQAGSGSPLRLQYYLFQLSTILSFRYDATGSLDDLERAISVARECASQAGSRTPGPAKEAAGQLGSLLRRRFLRSRKLPDLEEAIRLLTIRGTETGWESAAVLTNFGNAMLDRHSITRSEDDVRTAVGAQLRAVELTEAGDWQLASRHNNAGNALWSLYEAVGERSAGLQAEEEYRASLNLTSDTAPERASREYNLARVLASETSPDVNDARLEAARILYRAACRHGMDGSLEWALEAALGWSKLAVSRLSWGEAAEAYEIALDVIGRLFRSQLLREQKESWLRSAQGVPAEAAYAFVRAGQLSSAFRALESGRSFLLSEALQRDRADFTRLSAVGRQDLVVSYTETAERLALISSSEAVDVGKLRAARAEVDEVVMRIREVNGYESFLGEPNTSELFSRLAPGTTVAYLAAASTGGTALLVGPTQPPTTFIELPALTAAAVARRVSALFLAESRAHDSQGTWDGTLDAVCRWLWSSLMGPLLENLRPDSSVVLIPAGQLALLPLHAAWVPDDTSQTGRKYALDLAELHYAPNIQAVVDSAAVAAGTVRQSALVVSDPQPTSLPSVSFAAAEAAWAAYAITDVLTLHGEGAERERLLREMHRHSVVHLICHGLAQVLSPLESSLVLARDERVTLREILSLRLTPTGTKAARLAILSACETDKPGLELPDEIVSWPTGLLQAGASGVIATQWTIRGLPSALLMARFYQLCRGDGLQPAEALRKAQQWVRDTTNEQKARDLNSGHGQLEDSGKELWRAIVRKPSGERPYASPSHWAAFTYTGP